LQVTIAKSPQAKEASMKTLISFLALAFLLTGCGTTRCLNCPFTPMELSRSSNLAELNLAWELFEVNEAGQPGKQIGSLIFTWDGEITEQQWLTVQVEVTDQGQKTKQPPYRGLGADLNGETFLALCLDLPELAKMAGFSQPGNLAIPVYSLLRLRKTGKNTFLAEGITLARYQDSSWIPLDPSVQVNADGLVSNDSASLRKLLQEKKYNTVGTLLLKKKL